MKRLFTLAAVSLSCAGTGSIVPREPARPAAQKSQALSAVEAIGSGAEGRAQSLAYFAEASKVLTHARCTNCHTEDDSPRQRAGEVHVPPVERGEGGSGLAVLECITCHQPQNSADSLVPGAPGWRLAPAEMVWRGLSAAQICEALKDPKRNGGRTVEAIVEHSAHDELVGWAWSPGADREPAPGSQASFGELLRAWARSGAACP